MKYMIIVQILLVVALLSGYVQNIVKLANCDFEAPYKAEVIHTVGLLPPVGMVTGWIDVGQ